MARPNDHHYRKSRRLRALAKERAAAPPPPSHCVRKKRYPSRHEAVIGGRGALNAEPRTWRGPKPEALYVYACPHCKGWHLTSRPGPDNIPVSA